MKRLLLYGLMALLASGTSLAQGKNPTALGKWKGESICTVKPSPCHDEQVVYEITAGPGAKDRMVWKADKIVNGVQENMGTLDCAYAAAERVLTCNMPGKGVWRLAVQGDAMTGTLKLADGTLFRKVSVKRVE